MENYGIPEKRKSPGDPLCRIVKHSNWCYPRRKCFIVAGLEICRGSYFFPIDVENYVHTMAYRGCSAVG